MKAAVSASCRDCSRFALNAIDSCALMGVQHSTPILYSYTVVVSFVVGRSQNRSRAMTTKRYHPPSCSRVGYTMPVSEKMTKKRDGSTGKDESREVVYLAINTAVVICGRRPAALQRPLLSFSSNNKSDDLTHRTKEPPSYVRHIFSLSLSLSFKSNQN